jgi:hypothetical protein
MFADFASLQSFIFLKFVSLKLKNKVIKRPHYSLELANYYFEPKSGFLDHIFKVQHNPIESKCTIKRNENGLLWLE